MNLCVGGGWFYPNTSVSIRVHPWVSSFGTGKEFQDRMSAAHGLIHEEETERIIGCAMEVLNELGHGLVEKPYENALVVEFGLRGISYRQQPRYPVVYKSVQVGEFVPDLVAFGLVVVDAKVIERITDQEIGQVLNYLKVTGLRVGLILNFKYPRLEWKRVVL